VYINKLRFDFERIKLYFIFFSMSSLSVLKSRADSGQRAAGVLIFN